MNAQHDLNNTAAGPKIVYIRPVHAADLPEDIQEKTGREGDLYSVHAPNGDRLALVKDRRMAFALARQNDFLPVDVH